MSIAVRPNNCKGFSLIEVMIALMILTFGLLAVGQLIYIATSSGSLARSKGTAAIAAQSKLEYLSNLYSQNPSADELTSRTHGPQWTEVSNPIDGTILNRYKITWAVSNVSDPRPGKVLDAKLLRVTVTPIQSGQADNIQAFLNKVVNVTTIFSPRIP